MSFNQLKSIKSKLNPIKYGVPQGSIFGHVWFLCYDIGLPSVAKLDKI